jgi:hypothetical protein
MLTNYLITKNKQTRQDQKVSKFLIILLFYLFKNIQKNKINCIFLLYNTQIKIRIKTLEWINIKAASFAINTGIIGIKKHTHKLFSIKKYKRYKSVKIKPRNLNPKWGLLKNLIKKQKKKKTSILPALNGKIRIRITPQIIKNYFVYKIRRKKDVLKWRKQQKTQMGGLFLNFKKNTSIKTLFPNIQMKTSLIMLLKSYNKQKRKLYSSNPQKLKNTLSKKCLLFKTNKNTQYKNIFFVKTRNNKTSNIFKHSFSEQFYIKSKDTRYNIFLAHVKKNNNKNIFTTKRNYVHKKNEIKHSVLSCLFNFYDANLRVNDLNVSNLIKINSTVNLSQIILTKFTNKVGQNIQRVIKDNTNQKDVFKQKISPFYTHNNKQVISTNNYLPLDYIITCSQTNQKKINNTVLYYSRIGSLKSLKYKNFFIFFLLNFLEKFTHKKLWLRLCGEDFFSLDHKKRIDFFVSKHFGVYRRFTRLIAIRELLEIITIMSTTRDLQIFLYFIKQCFEKNHFKKHKKILSILFDVIKKNKTLFYENGVKGFFFDIRGKVGVSGNAKKRHLSFSLGKINTTSQNIRSYWQQINVWTPTGQMGITCYILY